MRAKRALHERLSPGLSKGSILIPISEPICAGGISGRSLELAALA